LRFISCNRGANSTAVRKRKGLFINGCECKRPAATVTEFFNSCQDRMCSGIRLKNNNISEE
jgi:hypothetical protein